MIISNLTGGLGNQMFQYALGRNIAIKNKTDLKLFFTNAVFCTQRNFGLECFQIQASIASQTDLQSLNIPNNKYSRLFFYYLDKFHLYSNPKIIIEKNVEIFDPNIINKTGNDSYLIGYWQNEKYFIDIGNTIRKDFAFKERLDSKNQKICDEIKQHNSCSIHVRRTDYLKYNDVEICNIDYYQKAIAKISSLENNPYFYIFSDDINWVKSNLKIKHPIIFIDHNIGSQAYKDMRLMSLCKHNIIANSSFSWWGAWLNKNVDKIVIGPRMWNKRYPSKNILPFKWIIIG
jgi:hypothetical protein